MFKNFKQTGRTKPLPFALYIGFFAGLFWTCLRLISYYLKFTTEPVGFLLKGWVAATKLGGWYGLLLGSLAFILLSILASVIYMWLFRRMEGPWPGLWYGLAWWIVLFIVTPQFGLTKLSIKAVYYSLATDACLFILWGMFIGFSIAFEFTDEASREPSPA